MDKVNFKTTTINGVRISETICTRRTGFLLVGTGNCCGCSYCYNIDLEKQTISCLKKYLQSAY